MEGIVSLSRALADGGAVIWEPRDRPRLRVGAQWAASLRRDNGPVREILRRAVIFRAQIEDSMGGPIVPYLILPGVPECHVGQCLSCGSPATSGWRCSLCLVAIYIALGHLTLLPEIVAAA